MFAIILTVVAIIVVSSIYLIVLEAMIGKQRPLSKDPPTLDANAQVCVEYSFYGKETRPWYGLGLVKRHTDNGKPAKSTMLQVGTLVLNAENETAVLPRRISIKEGHTLTITYTFWKSMKDVGPANPVVITAKAPGVNVFLYEDYIKNVLGKTDTYYGPFESISLEVKKLV